MVSKCSNCERFFDTPNVLCCTCGQFCSKECLDEYHKKKLDKFDEKKTK